MYKKIVMFLLVGLLSCSLFVCAFAAEEVPSDEVPSVDLPNVSPGQFILDYLTDFSQVSELCGFLMGQFYSTSDGLTIAGAGMVAIMGALLCIRIWYWVIDMLEGFASV